MIFPEVPLAQRFVYTRACVGLGTTRPCSCGIESLGILRLFIAPPLALSARFRRITRRSFLRLNHELHYASRPAGASFLAMIAANTEPMCWVSCLPPTYFTFTG